MSECLLPARSTRTSSATKEKVWKDADAVTTYIKEFENILRGLEIHTFLSLSSSFRQLERNDKTARARCPRCHTNFPFSQISTTLPIKFQRKQPIHVFSLFASPKAAIAALAASVSAQSLTIHESDRACLRIEKSL